MTLPRRLALSSFILFACGNLFAGSLRFHGTGSGDVDRVKISIDAPPRPADVANDFTLEWWMKATIAENNTVPCTPGPIGINAWMTGNVMFDRDVLGPGDYGEYGVSLLGGHIVFGVAVGSAGETLCGSTSVADGAWHHVALTRRASDGQIAIFVDGVANGTMSTAAIGDISYRDGRVASDPNDPFLVIGAEKRDAAGSHAYSGWIDEIRLSNIIRFTGTFARQERPYFTDANTVLLDHLDELSGDKIIDESSAVGGPSNGVRKFGGSPTAGPQWSTDSAPFTVANNLAVVPVVNGFSHPLGVVNAGDGSGRIFVVQQSGQIRIWDGTQILATPFLDISSRITYDSGERGLLGLAFHPQYATNGFFYVYYTGLPTSYAITIARYHVSANPNVADPTETVLLTIDHSQFANHNGGEIQFGPDGYLYLGPGDGGSGGDPNGNGQNKNVLLAKILRIDVNTVPYSIPPTNPFVGVPNTKPEIWAYGVRNPWRFSFDRLTGDLYIGDVGQNLWEEVDFQLAGIAGGQNYGWNVLEARSCYSDNPPGSCNAFLNGGSVLPVLWYDHLSGDCAIIGGYVFRGRPNSFVAGNYFYGDECSGRIWRGIPDGNGGWTSQQLFDTAFNISSFGEDEKKNLYFVDVGGGSLQRLTPYTFTDVPPTNALWRFVEAISAAGITSGCNPNTYCPGANISRAQMSVFLLLAKYGQTYRPPPATGTVFNDVPANGFAAAWIEQLYAEGITAGCGGGNFCPGSPVTRGQMAVFLLVAKEGTSYTPPPCTGMFTDVPCPSVFARWIEEIAQRGITAGCAPNMYCPAAAVTRGQMAVFVTQTFSLP